MERSFRFVLSHNTSFRLPRRHKVVKRNQEQYNFCKGWWLHWRQRLPSGKCCCVICHCLLFVWLFLQGTGGSKHDIIPWRWKMLRFMFHSDTFCCCWCCRFDKHICWCLLCHQGWRMNNYRCPLKNQYQRLQIALYKRHRNIWRFYNWYHCQI